MSHYKMFLDDERFPVDLHEYTIIRNYQDAVNYCKYQGCPQFISFDHDLGDAETGYDFAKWLVDQDLDYNGKWIPQTFGFGVHSQNPIGKKNIEGLLSQYLEQRNA